MDFFSLEGIVKFYREVALQVMSVATSLTVVVLAARQLPREFENRTIYPLLAKPVSRARFLLGKLLGVMLAAAFCFALFMGVYLLGALYLGGGIPWGLFAQYIYLQMLQFLVLATLAFWLSMLMNLDAAITLGALFMATSSVVSNAMIFVYDFVAPPAQVVLRVLNVVVPHLELFDLSEKAVHSELEMGGVRQQFWQPLGADTMLALTLYGGVFAAVYFGAALWCFRRRAL